MSTETNGWLVVTLDAAKGNRLKLLTADGEVLVQLSRLLDATSARVAIRAPKSVKIHRTDCPAEGRTA